MASQIIGCVKSSNQRYGMVVIAETVHGSTTAKLQSYRMDQNPYYGSLSAEPIYRIRQVINHLILNDYLYLTNDQYAILKLTSTSKDVLEGKTPLLMKFQKESNKEEVEERESNKKKRSSRSKDKNSSQMEVDEELFEKLRVLRMNIAKEEKIPPYIVFSDKTLKEMSYKKPVTEAQMLEVSGIGQFKYNKYGEKFMEIIKNNRK